MDERLLKPYDPSASESQIYRRWEESGSFSPAETGPTFTVIMPPPNANGRLHLGHALVSTLQDIFVRYHRMRGERTLWVPGADHAGFETQIVFDKKLEKEGRSRHDLAPTDLYQEILTFTLENKKLMEQDLRALGASCDWSREKFTLDPDVIRTVHQTFQKMHADGLIYRGKRLINWCAKHQTALSDAETETVEQTGALYYLRYGPVVIATARPETKFGDKYVVVHPADSRYQQYTAGQKIELEWINGPITATVVKDEAIDMEFGTGAMTITPWHDAADLAIAERHRLDKEQIIDWRGKLLPLPSVGEFAGLKIGEAREQIVQKLKNKNLLVKTEPHRHAVKVCYKCGTVIEPQIKDQWFVKMAPLAAPALRAVDAGELTFYPDYAQKILRHWLANTIDWNISRQIVWGIPIPAKLCDACESGWPDLTDGLKTCPTCGGPVRADTDTFDTWFSSGQWPLLALGYPDGADFKTFYPTNLMETGEDLLFRWLPRMIIFGLYLDSRLPFKTVYLNGMVKDRAGQKMSKSRGNVISPRELAARYGTDALRLALIIGTPPGAAVSLAEDKIKAGKHFANKLWNASRFVISHLPANPASDRPDPTPADRQILDELNAVVTEVTEHLEQYRPHLAAEKLYHYFWHTFADKIIEAAKPRLAAGGPEAASCRATLLTILTVNLKLLHPFMPFVTEAVWQLLPRPSSLLLTETWPRNF